MELKDPYGRCQFSMDERHSPGKSFGFKILQVSSLESIICEGERVSRSRKSFKFKTLQKKLQKIHEVKCDDGILAGLDPRRFVIERGA